MINDNLLEIINADKRARERISDSSKFDARSKQMLEEAKARLEEKYDKDAKQKIQASAKEHEKLLELTAETYEIRLRETEKNIEQLTEKKKNEWVSMIIRSVTEI